MKVKKFVKKTAKDNKKAIKAQKKAAKKQAAKEKKAHKKVQSQAKKFLAGLKTISKAARKLDAASAQAAITLVGDKVKKKGQQDVAHVISLLETAIGKNKKPAAAPKKPVAKTAPAAHTGKGVAKAA